MAKRKATRPTTGGLRDVVFAAIAALVAGAVVNKTGNVEAGQAAGEAAAQVGSEFVVTLTAILMGLITAGRKSFQDYMSAR